MEVIDIVGTLSSFGSRSGVYSPAPKDPALERRSISICGAVSLLMRGQEDKYAYLITFLKSDPGILYLP